MCTALIVWEKVLNAVGVAAAAAATAAVHRNVLIL